MMRARIVRRLFGHRDRAFFGNARRLTDEQQQVMERLLRFKPRGWRGTRRITVWR